MATDAIRSRVRRDEPLIGNRQGTPGAADQVSDRPATSVAAPVAPKRSAHLLPADVRDFDGLAISKEDGSDPHLLALTQPATAV